MQFSSTLLFAAMAALASAQNPFTFTSLSSITAGTPFNITWAPSTGTTDTVTLVLRQGDSSDLDTVQTIAAGIENTGSYVWTPPTSLVAGTDYAFQIVDDGNTAIVNYSNQFSIASTNTVSSARSSTASASSASASASGSSSAAATTTTASGSSSSGSASASGSSSSGTGSASSSASRSGSSSSGTASASRTATSSTSGSATGTTSTSTPTSLNAAGSLKVGGGMLAIVGAVMALL